MEAEPVLPSRRARILHVITALPVGGAEIMLFRLLSSTCARHEQAVVCLKDEGAVAPRIRDLGIPVDNLGLRFPACNYLRSLSMIAVMRRFRPDLVVGWMYHGNLMASLASRLKRGTPLVWGIHHSIAGLANEPWPTAAVIRLGARFSRGPARIVYVSHASKRQHEALGYNPSAGLVIPNGIDDTVFAPDEEARRSARAELGVDEAAVLIGLVARYHPMKDHAGFLRAAARVLAVEPTARFVLIGRGTRDHPEILERIAGSGIQDRVILAGERTDTPRLTAALDIACSSSAWGEACSVAVGEAMASAIPCVVTDVGDNASLVGNTGLSLPPRQTEAMAQAILQLIAAGPAHRRQLGQAARRRVQEHFSLSAAAGRYEDLYRACLRPSAAAYGRSPDSSPGETILD